jgi:putative DNA primase/helicase
MKADPDINDTLRAGGNDAVRARHDRAHRFNNDGNARRGRATPPLMLPPPSEPMQVAREFVQRYCLYPDVSDALTLHYWHDGWWAWRTSYWVEIERPVVRSLLYCFTEHAQYICDKGIIPWAPNRRKIGDLLEALSAIVILSDEIDQPCWIDGRSTGTIVAVANGLLDITSRDLHPHTPLYFNQTSVPFAYDPCAPEPRQWLDFLKQLWPHEPKAINALGEWFGYVISGLLYLHKIFMMVGPTRGGKGVIARMLTALIGRQNVAGPTLNSLGGDFGLAPLIGKPLAIISDARFVGRNSNVVVERLLSISGEDTLTVNRKYRDQWTGKLPTRLHVISNELPRLGDASTAVVGRIVLLLLTRSWLGKEDHELERRLDQELPGILNWSLAGLERLTTNNCFTRLTSSDEAITTMRDLASPVGAFVREKCEVGADRQTDVDLLFTEYKAWCADNEHPKASKHLFGRDLRAAVPSVRKVRPRDGGDRHHVYVGVSLRGNSWS